MAPFPLFQRHVSTPWQFFQAMANFPSNGNFFQAKAIFPSHGNFSKKNYNKNNTTDNDDVSRISINSDMVNSTISSESLDVTDNNSTLHSSEFNDDELFKELYEYVLVTKREAADNRTNNVLYAIRRNKHKQNFKFIIIY